MHQTPIAMTPESFLSGLTWPAYVANMEVNREQAAKLYAEIVLAPEDRHAFAQAVARHGGQLYVAALVEDWCGDVVVNLPLLARLAVEVPGIDLSLFVRSSNPDLAQAYAEQGISSMPVLSFFDADFAEVGRWVERPAAAQGWVQAWMAAYPQAEAWRQSSQPEDRRAYRALLKERLVDMIEWYQQNAWQSTLDELKTLLLG